MLFAVYQVDAYTEFFVQVVRYVFCRIYGTVLSSGTAEADREVGKPSFQKALYMSISQCVYVFQKLEYFTVLFQKVDNRFVASGQLLVLFVLSRIVHGTAVEYISASVS